jgi:hypothetical protein
MIKNILIAALLLPVPAFAQQVNEYDVCTRYREIYVPGYYDSYGNYISGRVESESYKVQCGDRGVVYRNVPDYEPRHRRQVYCDPTRSVLGAAIGGGLGAIFTNPNTRRYTIPIGAGLGGLSLGCR